MVWLGWALVLRLTIYLCASALSGSSYNRQGEVHDRTHQKRVTEATQRRSLQHPRPGTAGDVPSRALSDQTTQHAGLTGFRTEKSAAALAVQCLWRRELD